MPNFVAKRILFQNGERHSLLSGPGGLPVHEVTLYLARYRKRGRAANTIHSVCMTLALLYRELFKANIDLLHRLREGQFLTGAELSRVADAAQYWLADLSDDVASQESASKVVDIKRIRMRRKSSVEDLKAVCVPMQASRLRYIADFLDFLVMYIGTALPLPVRKDLTYQSQGVLQAFRGQVPRVSKRAKLGDREGLSRSDQDRVMKIIHPNSPSNPWRRGFVRQRNWVIVVLLFATGMRRGELLGLQIGDLDLRLPKLRVIRRADAREDPRRIQPNTKTNDRELELRPAIMRIVLDYTNNHRSKIKAARRYPQLIVADDGQPLSLKSIDKIFEQLRCACPSLPVRLTSHVTRHTWNERFSEEAELLGLSDAVEEKARNEQQGWTENSTSAATYTRRHTSRKGRELSLKIQEKLDVPTN